MEDRGIDEKARTYGHVEWCLKIGCKPIYIPLFSLYSLSPDRLLPSLFFSLSLSPPFHSVRTTPPSPQTLDTDFPWLLNISSTELPLLPIPSNRWQEEHNWRGDTIIRITELLESSVMAASTTTSQVYIDVIEDVMVKVRDEFINNGGPGEEVLKELQAVTSSSVSFRLLILMHR